MLGSVQAINSVKDTRSYLVLKTLVLTLNLIHVELQVRVVGLLLHATLERTFPILEQSEVRLGTVKGGVNLLFGLLVITTRTTRCMT